MTGYNRMNQRLAIKHTGHDGKREEIEYHPCPRCGAQMRTKRRAEQHCKPIRGEE